MKNNRDCPPTVIEVRRREDGTLDEIVAGDADGDGLFVHLEQIDDGCFWLGVSCGGYRQSVWIDAEGKGMIVATSEMDDFPMSQKST